MGIAPRSTRISQGYHDMGPPFQTVPSQTTAFAVLDYSTSLRLAGTLAREFATSSCPEWASP
jgi:hypothetical protein